MSILDRLKGFFNGLFAGMAQALTMQPFQIIKVRLQTQTAEAPLYNGIIDCLTKIVKNEGLLGLYKGTLTPLFGVGLYCSIRFGAYENFKQNIAILKGSDGKPAVLQQLDKSIAALAAGVCSSIALCFVDHTKTRIQIQKSQAEKVYTGSVDAGIKIFKQYGIRGLNRGQAPTTIRQSTGLCLFFTVIEKITKYLTPPDVHPHQIPIYVPLLAGGAGGIFYWGFNYPFDYVKTLMQSDKLGDYKYPTMMSVFRDQYRIGGWRIFFKGYVICMMRAFPVNASAVVTYRIMQRFTGHVSK